MKQNIDISKSDVVRRLRVLEQRYFEAETTPEEERELKCLLVLPEASGKEWDELRAVVGFTAVGRWMRRRKSHRRQWRRLTVAAVSAAVIGSMAWMAVDSRQNVCVAYIGGKRYTDEEVVMRQMHHSMNDMGEAMASNNVENQLSDMFRTMDNETEK